MALIACHDCDLLHHYQPLANGEKAYCRRCGALLYQQRRDALPHALALTLTALLAFLLAQAFPLLSLEFAGRVEQTYLISGVWALYQHGMGVLAGLVLWTSLLSPLLVMAGVLYLLLPRYVGWQPKYLAVVYRSIRFLRHWSMLAVLMLGVLIAFVKLQDLADVIPGLSLALFAVALIAYSAALVQFDAYPCWPVQQEIDSPVSPATTARASGLIACHTCRLLVPRCDAGARCPRCQSALHSRHAESVSHTWALLCTAALLLIPANCYPVMTVIQFGRGEPSTILGGVLHLMDSGMWGLALIVLFASVVVPVAKLGTLALLLISTTRGSSWRPADRTRLYRITEVIGAWSMVDIYVVAILTALVQMAALATIEPGVGAIFFGGAVVVTMLAAQRFDPRLIWDRLPQREVSAQAGAGELQHAG